MNQDEFEKAFSVPRETVNDLEIYERLLKEWNERFNLVAASTLPDIWMRHFADSAQLMAQIPESARIVADMGSGAGFPGLVLAIMAKHAQRRLHVHAIESTGKKADFLSEVVKTLGLSVTIERARIESIRDLKADVITARALKALPELLKYATYLIKEETLCLFLKGQSVADELTEARKYWTFESEIFPSRSDDTGKLLALRQLRYKTRR